MQSFEAMMSFLVFTSIMLYATQTADKPQGIDDSLLRIQLAEDAWRVLYIRNDFHDFGSAGSERIRTDMESISNQTGLCVFLMGSSNYTSCRGGERHEMTASIHRTLIIGNSPRLVTFSLGK
ncbi:MAG: hypothetical protein V1861_00760 [Candidatus Micrarchaeota archaeon]